MEAANTLKEPSQLKPDVIIAGTGMGGATLGYALAKAGKKVVFCEKGNALLSETDGLRGQFAEFFRESGPDRGSRLDQTLKKAGRYWEKIEDVSDGRSREFIPFIGSGGGGSSSLFGLTFERFLPSDFFPGRHFPGVSDSTVPESWPIHYPDLEPYYEEAERLYRTRLPFESTPNHSPDFLERPLPPLSATGRELFDFLAGKDMHPRRLPLAYDWLENCEVCQSYLCARNCKNDSNKICLKPAVKLYGALLLDSCQVLKLDATRNLVTGVVCARDGKSFTLKAPLVVLAAGALETPRILLNSASADWPEGLANDSGLVGKNLMRHYVDLYAVFPKSKKDPFGKSKEIGLDDFYVFKNQKLGTVQSFGPWIPPKVIIDEFEARTPAGIRPLFRIAKPFLRAGLNWISSHTLLLDSVMEDLPYEQNQVRIKRSGSTPGNRIVIQYRIHDYDKTRIQTFRKMLKSLLHPYRYILLKQAENIERIAHVCGTCRFGENPKTSVLDPWNRAHGISNLYVVDSSFFPSGGGTNPALTIAANALRVADHLVGRSRAKKS